MLTTILDILTAIAAIIAAFIWFKSANVKTPDSFSIHVSKPDGPFGEPLGGNPIGATYLGHAHSKDLQILAESLKKQSRQSAIAAIFAGISAIIQGISIMLKILNCNI